MQLTVTQDQLIEAAQQLDQDEFTRADVAGQLGVDKPDLKQAFVHARRTTPGTSVSADAARG